MRYAADDPLANALYAMIVPATIAKGRVVELSTVAALEFPGVVRILTSDDFRPPAAESKDHFHPPLTIKTAIDFRGEPVALVLAKTIEAAIEGVEAVKPRAAMLTGRPVKLVAPRSQMFHQASYRGRTRHRVRWVPTWRAR